MSLSFLRKNNICTVIFHSGYELAPLRYTKYNVVSTAQSSLACICQSTCFYQFLKHFQLKGSGYHHMIVSLPGVALWGNGNNRSVFLEARHSLLRQFYEHVKIKMQMHCSVLVFSAMPSHRPYVVLGCSGSHGSVYTSGGETRLSGPF